MASLQGRVQEQLATAAPKRNEVEPAAAAGGVDPTILAAKKRELRGSIPIPAEATEQGPIVEQAAQAAKQEVHTAPEPVTRKIDHGPPKATAPSPGPMVDAAAAGNLAQEAFAVAAAPEVPAAVASVAPLQPVGLADAAGEPLPPDPGAMPKAARIAAKIQHLRQAGQRLRSSASQQLGIAHRIRGVIHATQGRIAQGEAAVTSLQSHTAYRREITGQAKSALEVSQQKAAMVAEQAPVIAAKGSQGQEKSGPMAGEAKRLATENASKQPDNADAAAKSRDQGSKLTKVGSELGTMNDAISQTTDRAQGLVQEAAQAKAKNSETQGKISASEASLAQTEARSREMATQNAAARDHLAGLAAGPTEMVDSAQALDQQGEAYVQASIQMESRLEQARKALEQGMQRVPSARRIVLDDEEVAVQRDGYQDRVNLNMGGAATEALPSWLTGEDPASAQQRLAAKQAEDKRHRDELNEINQRAGGSFQRLDASEKAGIALRLTGRHLFESVGATSFPNFLGGIARAFVDPRVSLMGVVAGLSMTLSGVANLLSAEQWEKDPVGNLLKSAADIVTGITIVLGSIAGLAVAIIVVLTALTILTFGALGPIAAAVIPFCATVAATVGPWAITAAEIALLLQGLVLIKNLIDASTAQTAEELETKSDEMTEDAKAAGQMAMQVGMAKAMTAIGEAAHGGGEPPLVEAEPTVTEPHPVDVTSGGDLAPAPAPAELPVPAEPTAGMPSSGLELDTGPRPAPVEPLEPHPIAAGPEGPSGVELAEPSPAPARPPRILRMDDDFAALENSRGVLKAHIESDGSMVPASPAGDCTPLEHIYGFEPAKGASPYSSFLTEGEGGLPKSYGQLEVELDLPKLQADIEAGKLPGVEVLPPEQLQTMITDEIEATAKQAGVKVDVEAALENGPEGIKDYLNGIDGLSRGAAGKLSRRLLALFNTSRDGEYLVKGVVPARYLSPPKVRVPVP